MQIFGAHLVGAKGPHRADQAQIGGVFSGPEARLCEIGHVGEL